VRVPAPADGGGDEPLPPVEAAREDAGRITGAAVAAAAGAALVGAVAWAAIVHTTNYEIGYVAWGIGLLVGGAAVKLGGSGTTMGVTAAALTVLSILGGKLGGTYFAREKVIDEIRATEFTQAQFEELLVDARDFQQLTDRGDEAVWKFMGTHDYLVEEGGPLNAEELDYFREVQVPYLETLHAAPPTYEDWRTARDADFSQAFRDEYPLHDVVAQEAGLLDILFAGLGISTAFGLCSRAARSETARPRKA